MTGLLMRVWTASNQHPQTVRKFEGPRFAGTGILFP